VVPRGRRGLLRIPRGGIRLPTESTRDEGQDGIFIRYRTEKTAVEIGYDPTVDEIEVFLIKLERGRVPSYMDTHQGNWVPFFRYLDHLGACGAEGPKDVRWGDREGLHRALSQHAEALREHGGDVLTGDFSVFDEARAPELAEEQLYDVGEPSDPWVGAVGLGAAVGSRSEERSASTPATTSRATIAPGMTQVTSAR
jgi:hypothetical protein